MFGGRAGPVRAFDRKLDPEGSSAEALVFPAVQEQLGLKLESAKERAEILVIDHAEKPSGN